MKFEARDFIWMMLVRADGVAVLMGAGELMSSSGVLLANLGSRSLCLVVSCFITRSALVLAKLFTLDILLVSGWANFLLCVLFADFGAL